jgi:hypothetical protein
MKGFKKNRWFTAFGTKKGSREALTVPWCSEYENYTQGAKEAVRNGELEKALEHLFKIDIPELNDYTNQLASRLTQYERENMLGVYGYEKSSTEINRISRDTIKLIAAVEKSLQEESKINAKIKTYLTQRYQNRLDQKLAGRQPINLHKIPSSEGTSEETSSYFVSINRDDVQGTIQNIFEEAKGRVLITGVPGSGKTVLMLQLVLALLTKKTPAIPVVLNLASWQSSYIKLEVWLEKILPSELGINSAFAKKILKEIPLILLLDGLDEVKEEDRKSCLDAIGFYGADAQKQFVIASRKQEYVEVAKDAPVYLQVEVEPLQLDQIEEELKRIGYQQPEALPLLKAIKTDSVLQEVVKTPFYFNVLQLLFAQGMRSSDFNLSSNRPEELQQKIIQQFIDKQLNKSTFTSKPVLKWLSFLAFRMAQRNLVNFELVNLQYDWFKRWNNLSLVLGNFFEGLIKGLVIGMILGLVNGLAIGLGNGLIAGLNGLAAGLIGGLIIGLVTGLMFSTKYNYKWLPLIEVKDEVIWSLENYLLSVKKSLALGLVIGLMTGLIGVFVFKGFESAVYGEVEDPAEGLIYGLASGLVISLVLGLLDLLFNKHSPYIQIEKPYQRFIGSTKAIYFSILQHWVLRHQLYRKGLLPLYLVDFLNEMTKRHILESNGATWRFRHRIIQDYLAEQWEEPEESKPDWKKP